MAKNYYVKTIPTEFVTARDLARDILRNIKAMAPVSLKCDIEHLFAHYSSQQYFNMLQLLDNPSRAQVRRELYESLFGFAQLNDYIIRGIKVSKSGMLISFWITKI